MRKRLIAVILLCAACVFSLAGCGYSRHRVKDKNALETEVFLDKPDSMVVTYHNKETELIGDEMDPVYEKFMELMSGLKSVSSLKMYFTQNKVREWRKEELCIEFRYDRRRNYTGTLVGSESNLDLFTWGNLKFDAMLLILDGYGGINAVPYYNGSYRGVSDHFLTLGFDRAACADFRDLVGGYRKK